MPEPGAEQVAIAVLSASVRTSELDEVRERADRLRHAPRTRHGGPRTIEAMAAITQAGCAKLQR